MLMVRLSRTRRNDPILTHGHDETDKKVCGRNAPRMDVDQTDDMTFDVPLKDILPWIPSHSERRQILARDSLASTDGFRVLVIAAFKYLFGMNFCWLCPLCNDKNGIPCQDLDGRSCLPEGGILGRAEAAIACLESQKRQGPYMRTFKCSSNAHINTLL